MILDESLNKQSLKQTIDKMFKNANFYKKNLQKTGKNDANAKIIKLIENFS